MPDCITTFFEQIFTKFSEYELDQNTESVISSFKSYWNQNKRLTSKQVSYLTSLINAQIESVEFFENVEHCQKAFAKWDKISSHKGGIHQLTLLRK